MFRILLSIGVTLWCTSALFANLRKGEVLIYPTALKNGVNLLAGASWRKPLEKHAPHAVATFTRGGPFNADAQVMTLSNDHPEFAYWATMAQGIKTGRKYFFGTWAKIKSANLLCWVHGISTVNMKDAGFRVYNFSGGNPCLDLYLDDDPAGDFARSHGFLPDTSVYIVSGICKDCISKEKN